MTRRQFIKVLLKVAATSGVYPVLSYATALNIARKDIEGSQAYISGCMWCQAGCSMLIYVKDGNIVHLTGNPNDPVTKGRICVKPFGSLEILSSANRLKYPLKRIGNRLIKIGWKEALDEIAFKLKQIRDRYGPESLGIWASGRSAFDGRLLNKAFARLYGTSNYAKTGPFCNCSGKPAGISTVGSRHTPWIYEDGDFYGADLYIFAGSNMAATRPTIFKNLLQEKRKRGCRFVCLDPRRSQTAQVSDWWLPIRPGTDMALALGMIHYIISQGWEDKKFIERKTEGFEEFKRELFVHNYSIEWAAKITGLSQEDIATLAKLYVQTPKAIIIGNAGLSHHTNAVQTHRCFYFLAAITGHFGRPATGYGCLNNGGHKIGAIPLSKKRLPQLKPSLGPNPVKWLLSLEDKKAPYRLRALIATGSPLTQWPEQKRIRRLISKLDLSVWNGLVPSVNVRFFKYILPAATWIEAGGIAPVSDDSRFVFVPKLVEPPQEARPDRWWWIELGKRMGWEDVFRDELKDYKTLIDFACGRFGFGVKDFLSQPKTHALRAPKGRRYLFEGGRFLTKSGKFQFVDKAQRFEQYGLSSFPEFYLDPDLAQKGQPTIVYKKNLIRSPFHKGKCYVPIVEISKQKNFSGDYPLTLISGRPSVAIMGDAAHWSRKLIQMAPDQICLIHPETAQKYGISNKQKVKVISAYGQTVCLAVVSQNIRKETVFVPYSYGEKNPWRPWKSINFVTSANALDPIAGQVAFNGIRVKIERGE